MNDRCERYDGFAGIVVDCDGNSHLRPLTTHESDAGCVLLYGRANNISSNVAQLRSWIQQQGTESFQHWKRQQLQQCYAQVSQMAPAGKVRLLMPDASSIEASEIGKLANPALLGQDPKQHSIPTSHFASSFLYGPAGVLARQSLMQQQLVSVAGPLEAVRFGEAPTSNSTTLVREQMIRDLCRLTDRTDPTLLMIDRSLVENCFDEALSESLRSFCALPAQSLQESMPIDSASHTIHLRSGTSDGYLYVSLTGVVPWSSDVDLEMTLRNSMGGRGKRAGRNPQPTDPEIGGHPLSNHDPDRSNRGAENQATT